MVISGKHTLLLLSDDVSLGWVEGCEVPHCVFGHGGVPYFGEIYNFARVDVS